MIISEKQIMQLMTCVNNYLVDMQRIEDMTNEQRFKPGDNSAMRTLLNQILRQQSEELKVIE